MANLKRLFDAAMSGRGTMHFRDFEALLGALKFVMRAQKGSHRIYVHPAVDRPFPVQSDGKDAKRYQIRQLRDIIKRYRLTLDDGE